MHFRRVTILLNTCNPDSDLLRLRCVSHFAGTGFLKTSAIAHFAIGAPALYSLMGQWLDSQDAIAVPRQRSLDRRLVVVGSNMLSLTDRPSALDSSTSSRLATIHGISAVPIMLFAALHLTNHFVGLWGAQAHIAFMLQARRVYRNPAIEIALVSCFASQFATGIVLTWRGIARGACRRLDEATPTDLGGLSCRLSHVTLQCCRACKVSPTQRHELDLAHFLQSPHG